MAKNHRAFNHQKPSLQTMSHSPIYTAGVAVSHLSQDDDEDNDICPVCDGDCTCSHNAPRLPPTPVPVATRPSTVPGIKSLKIKLTVPPSMQRVLASAPKHARDSSASITGAGSTSSSSAFDHFHRSQSAVASTSAHGQISTKRHDSSSTFKRKGRPPKSTVPKGAAADRQAYGNGVTALPQSQSQSRLNGSGSRSNPSTKPKTNQKTSRQLPKPTVKGTIAKKPSKASSKKKATVSEDQLSDSDLDLDLDLDDEDEDDVASGCFPTFVSASALTSSESSSSDSESSSSLSSGFDSDSSLEAEEENYILTEQRREDKARVKRELLGDDSNKRKDPHHNNWVIRPRKKSVGLSDVDMDGDSTEQDESDLEDEEDDEMAEDEEDEETDGVRGRVYTGVATGYSEEEESSFDADLFFANLSDTDTSSGSEEGPLDTIQAEVDATSEDALARSTDFEVTEGWDGQIVFTNGFGEGQCASALDFEFETTTAQLISASDTQDSDVEMNTGEEGADGDDDDDGAEDELNESDGETTEEELVDDRGLPTSRAMRLFQWPASVSAINPLSTVSPTVSPGPHNRRPSIAQSPRPADILAGKVYWEDESDDRDSATGSTGSVKLVRRGGLPMMGQFDLGPEVTPQKKAILTGSNKDVPSPFPRSRRRRRFGSSSGGSFSSMDFQGRTSRLSIFTPNALPLPSSSVSEEFSSQTSPELVHIELDDVLDASYLAAEPSEHSMSADAELHRHLQRWDRVPVGAFRLTRESTDDALGPSWTGETPKTPDYGAMGIMKSSPLSTMLWQDKSRDMSSNEQSPPYQKSSSSSKSKNAMAIIESPVLLAVRDGDRTPTSIPTPEPSPAKQNHKTRKEQRREMKMMKRKTHGPVHHQYPQHHRHHHQHHHHQHHANMKSRSTASVQRTNFFSSPTSIPPLNI
ncbi:hypothetical protein BJ138DRAFT_1143562 [Hygrophoropsis aurantiaca]|uniref:Uncharacterized protein n=1 Tax=Hygrophoropsis aurantiaca TaxID=72124 RepID=A0ACB8AN02_9AGAM|nr:hypothetical protein BJ138DRAFT_1143562 [Hygrophoropsis aurantiaca]